ncbi:hypothetical protein KIN20_035330 [Parelaphostrongylus tenuis]|uniref:Uncharacterized protein n=1 Tax=Parelaphostrongylus tenuis TaxID=148309 RepID=A0AAD5WKD0_PARTN|nr:hypothetical protein KIN20_035330 [Parelaphostrongylus tenuis]
MTDQTRGVEGDTTQPKSAIQMPCLRQTCMVRMAEHSQRLEQEPLNRNKTIVCEVNPVVCLLTGKRGSLNPEQQGVDFQAARQNHQ